jgi:hypothetical protein
VKHIQYNAESTLLSQLQRWVESHDSPHTTELSKLADLSHQDSSVTPPCLSLRCTPPQTELLSHVLLTCLCSWLCALCSYMDSKCHLHESSHPLGVSCPLRTIVPKRTDVPLCGPSAPNELTHQSSHLLDRHTPSLSMHTPCLVLFLVSIDMTLRGCADGVIQPLQCTHATKGRQVHSLGVHAQVAPSLPKHNPSLHHPSQGK